MNRPLWQPCRVFRRPEGPTFERRNEAGDWHVPVPLHQRPVSILLLHLAQLLQLRVAQARPCWRAARWDGGNPLI